MDVNVGDNNVQFCQGAKCPKPSFITTLGPFHHGYALFFKRQNRDAMVRHVSAVLMHHNLCKQQRLTYIYTNGDSILPMVGFESGIPGF